MLHFLLAKIPPELVCEIALFDGRIFRAQLRDYITEVYAREYQSYFGYRYTLRFLCGGHTPQIDQMSSLPFYAAWSTRRRRDQPKAVKQRKPRSHMRTYVGIIPTKRLEQERAKIEKSLAQFFTPNTEHLRYRGLIPLPRPV